MDPAEAIDGRVAQLRAAAAAADEEVQMGTSRRLGLAHLGLLTATNQLDLEGNSPEQKDGMSSGPPSVPEGGLE